MSAKRKMYVTPVGPWRFLTPFEPTQLGDAVRFIDCLEHPSDSIWEYPDENSKWAHSVGDVQEPNYPVERIRPLDTTAQLVVTEACFSTVHDECSFFAGEETRLKYGKSVPGTIIPRPVGNRHP